MGLRIWAGLAALCLCVSLANAQGKEPEVKAPTAAGMNDARTVREQSLYDRKETQKKKEKKTRPALGAEMRFGESQAQQAARNKGDQAIAKLKEIIAAAPDDQKPELYFTLTELLWEKSRYSFLAGMGMDDRIFQAEDAKDVAAVRKFTAEKEALLAESDRMRTEVIALYRKIVSDYPNYKRIDHILFYYAFNLERDKKRVDALRIYKELIKRFPKSKFIPDAYLAHAEYYFDENNMDEAEPYYERVLKFPDSTVYGYALYKEGWVYFNRQDYKKAMTRFLQVIKHANEDASRKNSNKLALKREAVSDLVLTYSMLGKAQQAIEFFQRVAEKDYLELVERLAKIYIGAEFLGGAHALDQAEVTRSRVFFEAYRAAPVESRQLFRSAPRIAGPVGLQDLVTYGLRASITFASLLCALILQRLHR